MNDTLKVAGRIGAELGAAKAEVERLREALRPFATFEAVRSKQGGCTPKRGTVWAVASAGEDAEITVEHLQAAVAALSQQAEPTDTFTAVDMATAAAQGFRDGQAAVEQATAQDERRDAFNAADPELNDLLNLAVEIYAEGGNHDSAEYMMELLSKVEARLETRPAQTEQQPVAWAAQNVSSGKYGYIWHEEDDVRGWINLQHQSCDSVTWRGPIALYAAPIAQTAPQPEQGGLVGQVCGGDGTHNTVNVAVIGPVPWGDLRIGTPVRLIPAPATPSPAMDAKEA
jgi:hypothetical protein